MSETAILSSAAGVLSLLDEPDDELKIYALEQLNDVVNVFWSEIANAIPKIECLYEDDQFAQKKLAAVVASKVFFHLEELDDALKYALGAEEMFDVGGKSEFVEAMIAKCIDEYTSIRVQNAEKTEAEEDIKMDTRLAAIVERMFARMYQDGQYKQALGIALESRRLDELKQSILTSGDIPGMLAYCFQLSQEVLMNRKFRTQVLRILSELYHELGEPDYINMCQCLLFLDDSQAVATALDTLVQGDVDQCLMAYQVAFDLSENQNQPFLNRVSDALPSPGGVTEETDAIATPGDTKKDAKEDEDFDDSYVGRMGRLKAILSGELPANLYLHFLHGQNQADLRILNFLKDKLEERNSVTHNATVMAHAIMNTGTTSDVFLSSNQDWLGRANNWAKFTATASIGVIHKGHHKSGLKVLSPFLPNDGQSGSPYQEGGALYALGLIQCNQGSKADSKVDYLKQALANNGTNEIIQHGAALGLGLSAMATQDEQVYEELKAVVYTESAVAGEAAGIAIGLVLLGSGNGDALEEMLAYAHDTKHEKIIRGLAMGMALMVYGREEAADGLIEQLVRDKDHILRYGGMYAIAMAYVGTANNSAVRRLLHVAVSDVDDDVRRAAVTALGFVLCNVPDQVPRIVSLLAESFNPYVRYGACFAVGIACASSGSQEAIKLLEPLMKDKVDFVRQAGFIAMAMVLVQHNEAMEPKVKQVRKAFNDTVSAKGDTVAKFGAIVAAGILDAGGRNMNLTLLSPSGHKKIGAIVGMALFPQFWYWYPLIHFISLALTPTAVIGLNKQLKIPREFKFQSNARPSLFAYPPPLEVKKEEKKKKVKTAILSVSRKAKARAKKKEGGDAMDTTDDNTEGQKKEEKASEKDDMCTSEDAENSTEATTDAKQIEEPEPEMEVLVNPARVTSQQHEYITWDPEQRYTPVKKQLAGFVMLKNSRPDDTEDCVVFKQPKIGIPGIDDNEPEPPKPFQFLRD